jgi:predicted DNA-binding transcriptional regulator AlpA
MATCQALADVGITPRLLTREQAAAYCGIGLAMFTNWVRSGIIPGPVPGTHRWDRKAIDAALDQASGLQSTMSPSPLDAWKARHNAHES